MARLIDLIVEAARSLIAEYQPVQLCKIKNKAINMDKEHSYKESSYDAELNYHTINMKSRYFDKKEKIPGMAATWKREPYFYRTSPGFYRLLTEEDKKVFYLALNNDLDIIYKDEYPLEILYSRVKNANLSSSIDGIDYKNNPGQSYKEIIKTEKYLEYKPVNKTLNHEHESIEYNEGEKDIILSKIGKLLIGVYNNNKIPRYLEDYNKCGFTINNLTNDPNYLFRLLVFAAYDQGPFTGSAKGWEPIWGISGSQKLPEILANLELFSLEDIKKHSIDSISGKLGSVTFYNYHIDKKNSICPEYAKTFKTIFGKITEDSLLNKFIEADSKDKILDLFDTLMQIENIGETITSKIIMYVLREIHINNINNSCFCDVANKIMGEFHNNRLIKELDNYYFYGFSQRLYEVLVKNGDPYAIDALYYIDRDDKSLKKDLFKDG